MFPAALLTAYVTRYACSSPLFEGRSIAQWKSTSVRRRPRFDSGSITTADDIASSRETDAPSRESAVGKGKTVAPVHHGSVTMTTVCTCNPDVNWIRFIVERVSDVLLVTVFVHPTTVQSGYYATR